MSAALSQPDAARFTIFIDHAIESPRFNFSAFCQAARISAAEALTWFRRPDIEAALNSCITFIEHAARIRHVVLDTNAMGALGELLKSDNQIEVRRAATTIIPRHKLNLRASSCATAPGGTGLPTGASSDSASRATIPASRGSTSSRRDAATVMSPGRPRETSSPNTQLPEFPASTEGAPLPTAPSAFPSTLRTQYAALLKALDLEARLLRRTPSPREPHSARTLLTRVGSARSRDHP